MKFKPGMAVRHRCGSPQMIIKSVSKSGKITCTYFIEGYLTIIDDLKESELELATDQHGINSNATAGTVIHP